MLGILTVEAQGTVELKFSGWCLWKFSKGGGGEVGSESQWVMSVKVPWPWSWAQLAARCVIRMARFPPPISCPFIPHLRLTSNFGEFGHCSLSLGLMGLLTQEVEGGASCWSAVPGSQPAAWAYSGSENKETFISATSVSPPVLILATFCCPCSSSFMILFYCRGAKPNLYMRIGNHFSCMFSIFDQCLGMRWFYASMSLT